MSNWRTDEKYDMETCLFPLDDMERRDRTECEKCRYPLPNHNKQRLLRYCPNCRKKSVDDCINGREPVLPDGPIITDKTDGKRYQIIFSIPPRRASYQKTESK